MRMETRIGAILFVISMVINRFAPFSDSVAGVSSGLCLSLGIFLLVVGMIPENYYTKLLYRKWIGGISK